MPLSAKTIWINQQYSTPENNKVHCKFVNENGAKCNREFATSSKTHMREHLFDHESTKRHLNRLFNDFGKKSAPSSSQSTQSNSSKSFSFSSSSSPDVVDLTTSTKKRRLEDEHDQSVSLSNHCAGCQCGVDQSKLEQGFARQMNLLLEPACAEA